MKFSKVLLPQHARVPLGEIRADPDGCVAGREIDSTSLQENKGLLQLK